MKTYKYYYVTPDEEWLEHIIRLDEDGKVEVYILDERAEDGGYDRFRWYEQETFKDIPDVANEITVEEAFLKML